MHLIKYIKKRNEEQFNGCNRMRNNKNKNLHIILTFLVRTEAK